MKHSQKATSTRSGGGEGKESLLSKRSGGRPPSGHHSFLSGVVPLRPPTPHTSDPVVTTTSAQPRQIKVWENDASQN